jgi:perosamine synthetase
MKATGARIGVRLVDVRVGPESEQLVLEVLRSGRLAQGPMVERFESLCAEMAGTRYAVAVSSGTASLEAALSTLGIGPGDEVVTSPLTFAATLNAVLRTGAVARFADVATDCTIDPDSVASLIGPSTAAILPVHLYGLPADMPRLVRLAAERGLAVVEDAAQAHGAIVGGSPVGSFGVGCFSFYATKNVTSGEGGVVTTSDDTIAHRVRLLRNQGMSEPYHYEVIGGNLRMTEVQAAIAIPQLERLDAVVAARARNARALSAAIGARLPAVALPDVPDGRVPVWHLYTVLLPAAVDRAQVVADLEKRNVEAAAYYPTLVWDHPPYRDHPRVVKDPTPRAAEVARRCLSLPVHPGLDRRDPERIAEALADVLTP